MAAASATSGTAIGLDVGGTRIRAARIGFDGAVLYKVIEPVRSDRDGFAVQVLRLIDEVRDDTVVGVGIGIPGRVDAARGTILSAGYLDIAGLELTELVRARTGLQARLENDATMALLAEVHARPNSAQGVVAIVTVGTGIGGAVVVDGAPWYGGGLAGQFGHLVVAHDGPRCNCGRRGCVETFSSGTALGRLIAAAGMPHGVRVEDLLRGAERGEDASFEVLRQWAVPFHRALQTLVAAIDPRLIVLGGGLGGAMAEAQRRLAEGSDWFRLPFEAARLGDDAGVIGAGIRGFAS
ncbi:MAG: ROK family protein [Pseudomonadota bacterium]